MAVVVSSASTILSDSSIGGFSGLPTHAVMSNPPWSVFNRSCWVVCLEFGLFVNLFGDDEDIDFSFMLPSAITSLPSRSRPITAML